MKCFAKKVFDGGGYRYQKNRIKSINYTYKLSKLVQYLNKKWRDKFPEFNKILGTTIILASLFIVGKTAYSIMISNVNGKRVLSKISVLKNNFLYQETFDKIASMLVVYDAKVKDKPLEFIRLGKDYDGGYVVPVAAMESADALMGYGIADDISFERDFSQRFDKPSFGFDCGVGKIETGDSRCHFFSECIGTSDYLYRNQKSSGRIASFSQQLQRLRLADKKVFIKMDIEGAEFEVMDDILKHSQNITGMVLEIHIPNGNPEKVSKSLSSINRHFTLVHLHGNNSSDSFFKTKYSTHPVPYLLELSYVNNNLVNFSEVSKNQKHPRSVDQRDCTNLPEYEFEVIPN